MITPVSIACPGASIARAACATLPMLRTERLTLRAPQLEDFTLFATLFRHPSAKFMGQTPEDTDIWAQFTNYTAGWVLRGDGMFTVLHQDKPIGFVFAGVEPGDQAIELGFFIAPEAQRKGFAFEAAKAALAHLRSLGPDRVVSYVDPGNGPSQGLVSKLGAIQDGTLDGAMVFYYPLTRAASA